MEIMITAHEGKDSRVLLNEQVSEMDEAQLLRYARCFLPVVWQWDDDMQLVYHETENSYILLSYYE